MKNESNFLIMGLVCLLLFANIIAFNPLDNANESSYNNLNLDKTIFKLPSIEGNVTKLNATNLENDTGCTSVIVHVKPGHDIVSYRRDSNYSADIMIENMTFNGQNAIHEYKTQGGYFTHVIITENGWIISIGGKDNPDTNKQLEKLGSEIISNGSIGKKDLDEANAIIKRNGWGHFVIKSPDDNVGVAIYDSRVSSSMTRLFKMNDGDYVKVPNTSRYYDHGNFNKYSNDPINAAIQIIGTDLYGVDRRDVITYDLINNNSKKVDIWASFDGGALLKGDYGEPDNILFFGNEIHANELPKILDKKFLGEEILQNDNLFPTAPMNLEIAIIGAVFGIITGFLIVKSAKKEH